MNIGRNGMILLVYLLFHFTKTQNKEIVMPQLKYEKMNERDLKAMIRQSLSRCCEGFSEPERKRRKRIYDESEIIERPGSLVKVIGFISPLFKGSLKKK